MSNLQNLGHLFFTKVIFVAFLKGFVFKAMLVFFQLWILKKYHLNNDLKQILHHVFIY
jgi:hypothetical protein